MNELLLSEHATARQWRMHQVVDLGVQSMFLAS